MNKKPMTLSELADKLKGRTPKLLVIDTPKPAPVKVNNGIKKYHDRAGIVDSARLDNDKSLKDVLKSMPDLSTRKMIEVAPKTWIAVDPTRNPEKARRNFNMVYKY